MYSNGWKMFYYIYNFSNGSDYVVNNSLHTRDNLHKDNISTLYEYSIPEKHSIPDSLVSVITYRLGARVKHLLIKQVRDQNACESKINSNHRGCYNKTAK